MMEITAKMVGDFMRVNLETVDMASLADIGALMLDNDLPQEKRLAYVVEKLKNPLCFRCGNMGIKLAFDDQAPPLQEALTAFLIRKKSGV